MLNTPRLMNLAADIGTGTVKVKDSPYPAHTLALAAGD